MGIPGLERLLADLYGEPAPPIELEKLKGDASTRTYFRARVQGPAGREPASLIVMQLPHDAGIAGLSDEGGAQPAVDRLPFLEVAELLASRGLPVPKVYVEDLDNGVLLLEDLGDRTLHAALLQIPKSEWPALYSRAIDLLAEMHERCEDLPERSVVRKRRFDRALLDWELDHFREWGLETPFGSLSEESRRELDRAFSIIVCEIATMPYGFVHRDYQSKNLMVAPTGALTLIDFQDALLGPRAYDLVALLCDSYVSLEIELQDALIARYAAARRIDEETLRQEFWWVALHRKLKDAGRFIFIDRVRKNPDFLQWFPQSLAYVGRAVAHIPRMTGLQGILETSIPGFPDSVSEPVSTLE
jgi:aminoglycoside/choline kinase family phosphotransferase